jgi:prepilin-type N-terminal cleavage/methylation domain-containing protein
VDKRFQSGWKPMARKWFKQRSQHLRLFFKHHTAGFTLLELLVALFIGGIITSTLLFAVVELLQTNQREASRSDTQREMQMALDYIARDLREAVYVYDGNCLTATPPSGSSCRGLLNYLPDAIAKESTNLPVLAFWRLDPLPPGIEKLCRDNAGAFSGTDSPGLDLIRGIPCVSRRMYTLVVYSLKQNVANDNWSGKGRITRYTIPQYAYGATNSTYNAGWAPIGSDVAFTTWPFDNKGVDQRGQNGSSLTPTADTLQVLVDFVDFNGLSGAVCPPTAAGTPGYITTPAPSVAGTRRGFYACVRGADNSALNQEVVVILQGNAAGRPGLDLSKNIPITMQTRVMTRGVVDKTI